MRASHIALIAAMLAIPSVGYANDEQDDFKQKFKAGCQSSGGSFVVDDPDGNTFRCNAPSGGVTKCFAETPPHPCEHYDAQQCKFGC